MNHFTSSNIDIEEISLTKEKLHSISEVFSDKRSKHLKHWLRRTKHLKISLMVSRGLCHAPFCWRSAGSKTSSHPKLCFQMGSAIVPYLLLPENPPIQLQTKRSPEIPHAGKWKEIILLYFILHIILPLFCLICLISIWVIVSQLNHNWDKFKSGSITLCLKIHCLLYLSSQLFKTKTITPLGVEEE